MQTIKIHIGASTLRNNFTFFSKVEDTVYSPAILLLGSYSTETSTQLQRHAQGRSLVATCNSNITVCKW